MGKLKVIINRIYSDYLMPSRLDEYENIIKETLDDGYIHLTLKEYCKILRNNSLQKDKKYFINRHDIDTDLSTAKEFFKIEKKYGVKATYYFRLSTLDFDFMKEIEEYGSEASYHFEEIAQYAKDNHIKSRDELLERMDEIRDIFQGNFKKIESSLEYKIETVCSHGDFVNRKLQIVNNEITKDKHLKSKLGIICETYDTDIIKSFDIYISDRPYPIFYAPQPIFDYIGTKNKIYMLTHPRQWRTSIVINTIDNIKRIYELLKW